MPKEQLVMRMLASEARVDSQRIRTGKLIESDWAKLAQAAGVLADANIHIDDTPAISALELRAKCRRLFSKYEQTDQPIRLIVVDYLQLMRGKERNGPIGTANLAFIHEHTRFENLAREYTPGGAD